MSEGFGLDHLPYGVFSTEGSAPRVGVRYPDTVVDAATVRPELDRPTLNDFMARGPATWAETRAEIAELVAADALPAYPVGEVALHLPFAVGDYVDFYASLDHASNVGRIFRPDQEPLLPNWRHLPVGYHGRGGTVVVSGTPIVRPCGQRKAPTEEAPTYGPSRRLDIEAELGFVVGVGSELGSRIGVASAEVPSQTRCEWMRVSSASRVRIQTAFGGVSSSRGLSIAITNTSSFCWKFR